MADTRLPVVILISGGGTNLQAIIDAQQRGELPIEIRAVISNRADAFGLERARRACIAISVVEHTQFASRAEFDQALQTRIDATGAQLIILAGFMRILTPDFVQHYSGRLLNIHPSLLPKHRGLRTHEAALAAGDAQHGASVHFVSTELDGGPVIAQTRVPILADDTAATLAERVRAQERIIYPLVIGWYASGRLRLSDGQIVLDEQILRTPRLIA
ncbi:MAG: phosphoribosylglycinamide formyltransferase [Gammaproteobacteria bacterium]|nr:phosphoribosylglycinamide formyltransferase [Gammaproteobacteria bacterium]